METKTNRTYAVYVTYPGRAGRLGTGSKKAMVALYEQAITDPLYDCVKLIKWSAKYNCWDTIKHYLSNI